MSVMFNLTPLDEQILIHTIAMGKFVSSQQSLMIKVSQTTDLFQSTLGVYKSVLLLFVSLVVISSLTMFRVQTKNIWNYLLFKLCSENFIIFILYFIGWKTLRYSCVLQK